MACRVTRAAPGRFVCRTGVWHHPVHRRGPGRGHGRRPGIPASRLRALQLSGPALRRPAGRRRDGGRRAGRERPLPDHRRPPDNARVRNARRAPRRTMATACPLRGSEDTEVAASPGLDADARACTVVRSTRRRGAGRAAGDAHGTGEGVLGLGQGDQAVTVHAQQGDAAGHVFETAVGLEPGELRAGIPGEGRACGRGTGQLADTIEFAVGEVPAAVRGGKGKRLLRPAAASSPPGHSDGLPPLMRADARRRREGASGDGYGGRQNAGLRPERARERRCAVPRAVRARATGLRVPMRCAGCRSGGAGRPPLRSGTRVRPEAGGRAVAFSWLGVSGAGLVSSAAGSLGGRSQPRRCSHFVPLRSPPRARWTPQANRGL